MCVLNSCSHNVKLQFNYEDKYEDEYEDKEEYLIKKAIGGKDENKD